MSNRRVKGTAVVSQTVDVIVPVFGNWAVTADCLASLDRQTLEHRVILVDDKSPDDTLERVTAGFPDVHVVALERNSGFAAACNRGLAEASADVVVLFNNDVVAEPDMLEQLVAPFSDPAVGSVSPLLLQPNGTVDAFGITADRTVAGFLRLHGAEVSEGIGPLPRLLGPYGAVAAYRRSAIQQVGGLDEGIFMYGEELDLALRLSAAGWRPVATAAARGMHLGGATSGRGSARQRERAGFGRGYLMRAYRPSIGRYFARALVVETIVCAADLLLSRDLASARGRMAGWRAGRLAGLRPSNIPDLDTSIGFIDSLRMRRGARA